MAVTLSAVEVAAATGRSPQPLRACSRSLRRSSNSTGRWRHPKRSRMNRRCGWRDTCTANPSPASGLSLWGRYRWTTPPVGRGSKALRRYGAVISLQGEAGGCDRMTVLAS